MKFVPSLELSRMLYEREISPILGDVFPDLQYAAATLGMCSEILGLDDEVSMDHEWGPRIRLFLSERDRESYAQDVMSVLRERLPAQFAGFDMMWRQPGVDVHDTRETILYHVSVGTVSDALRFCGGIASLPLQDLDWLRVSEQHLLEFTSGTVYRDDLGELSRARQSLVYYTGNVHRFLLMSQWGALNGDWFAIGRIGSRGDKLGLRIQASRAAQHLMRIAYMVSKTYMPYKKWFGTLFGRLPVADVLEPILLNLLDEHDWRRVEERISEAALLLLQEQNKLGLTPPVSVQAERMHDGRHHLNGGYRAIYQALYEHVQPPLKALMENQVFWLDERRLILGNEEVAKWSLLLQK